MNDEQLDTLIDAARANYRVPPEPPLDRMWHDIAQRRARHARPSRRRVVRWWGPAALAAGLVLSFSLGRYSVGGFSAGTRTPEAATAAAAQQPPPPSASASPITSATSDLLGRTAVLLTALPSEAADPASDRRFAQQAAELLVTTRLLLDSPWADDSAGLRTLLQDLELMLAQVARLRAGQASTERDLITEALEQQDLVPRIRTIAAGLGAGAD